MRKYSVLLSADFRKVGNSLFLFALKEVENSARVYPYRVSVSRGMKFASYKAV